jgi:hypothetical protein
MYQYVTYQSNVAYQNQDLLAQKDRKTYNVVLRAQEQRRHCGLGDGVIDPPQK